MFPERETQYTSRERLVEGRPGDRPPPPWLRGTGTEVCAEVVAVTKPPHEACWGGRPALGGTGEEGPGRAAGRTDQRHGPVGHGQPT